MQKVLTAAEMRQTEQAYFSQGASSLALMEKAASFLAAVVWSAMPPEGKTCAFACGCGGNGGDGFAAARLFAERGGRAIIVASGEVRNPDAQLCFERVREKVFACVKADELEPLPRPDVWADCLYGIGLSRAPAGSELKLIGRMNADRALGSRTVACDIPSGLDADTGEMPGACVQADLTVTFQALKRGHLLGRGMEMCGDVRVCDIGIPDEFLPPSPMRLIENADVGTRLPSRPRAAHKNDFGHLLIVAGSLGMAGAAAICAGAALRTGAGLVTVACPQSIVNIIQTLVPCAMCVPLSDKDGALSDGAAEELRLALKGKTALAIGPGLSRRASARCIQAALESGVKAVIDADALNIISEQADLKALLHPGCALTPHPGEAARLTGQTGLSQAEYALALQSTGAAVLVKGASSVIAGSGLYVSSSGCVGMAKGGSGDALTGMTGALLAQGTEPFEALWAASQLHGLAGEAAEKRFGKASMLATDLVDCIPEAFKACAG